MAFPGLLWSTVIQEKSLGHREAAGNIAWQCSPLTFESTFNYKMFSEKDQKRLNKLLDKEVYALNNIIKLFEVGTFIALLWLNLEFFSMLVRQSEIIFQTFLPCAGAKGPAIIPSNINDLKVWLCFTRFTYTYVLIFNRFLSFTYLQILAHMVLVKITLSLGIIK